MGHITYLKNYRIVESIEGLVWLIPHPETVSLMVIYFPVMSLMERFRISFAAYMMNEWVISLLNFKLLEKLEANCSMLGLCYCILSKERDFHILAPKSTSYALQQCPNVNESHSYPALHSKGALEVYERHEVV